MRARVYFLAWLKHDEPQHLVYGPFPSEEQAAAALRANHRPDELVIVQSHEMEFEVVS